jgi:hypothetical protein
MIQTKLNHRSRIFLEYLLVAQLVKKRCSFYSEFYLSCPQDIMQPSSEPDKLKAKAKFFCALHEGA